MNRILLLIQFILLISATSCDPSEEEIQLERNKIKQKKDSIAKAKEEAAKAEEATLIRQWGPNYIKRIDSAKASEKKIRQEKVRKYFIFQYGEKAWKIKEKHPDWSEQACVDLANRKIWIGMKYDQLVFLRGKPDHINTSNYGNGNQYQCCWDTYNPSCVYMGEDQIITAYN